MTDWRTTLGGLIGAAGVVLTSLAGLVGVPLLAPIGGALTALGHAVTGIAAKDRRP